MAQRNGNKTPDRPSLGTGAAERTAKLLEGRKEKLKRQECNALGLGYNQETGQCRRGGNK